MINLAKNSTLVVGTTALLCACATAPQPNPRIVAAENALFRAEADSQTLRLGRASLEKAEENLGAAKAHYREGNESAFIHTIRLTEGYIELAEVRGEQGATEAKTNALKQERSRVRVSASEQDAAFATQRALAAEERARRARTQLEAYKQKQTEEGLTLVLQDLQFPLDSAELRAGAQARLQPLADYLASEPEATIRIEGHTDSTGDATYNRDLSRRRAQSVASFLVSQGVAAARITVVGRGEDQPVASNETRSGREENRRVEITIL